MEGTIVTIVIALIAAAASIGAAGLAAWVTSEQRRQGRALDSCLSDRRQLKQLIQLVAGAFVGTLPERERLTLLRTIDEAINDDDGH